MNRYDWLIESAAFVVCMILSTLVLLGIASVVIGTLLIVAYAIIGGR